MSKETLITSRDPKGRHAVSLFEAAYNKAGLNDDRAQKLNECGGLFRDRIIALIDELTRPSQFSDEEVESSYAYPDGYAIKGIAEQVAMLRSNFPELKDSTYDENVSVKPLPTNAEGWFAVPRWEALSSAYGQAVDKVLVAIGSKRRFYNYREGQTGPEYLRQHARTVGASQKLETGQKGHDILIVPCQFGLRHHGRSDRRAREVMTANEFGLSSFHVGCMLVTHPERETEWEQLHPGCPGDEFSPSADGQFLFAPYFYFNDGKLRFYAGNVDDVDGHFAAASGFLSE